MRMPSIPPLLCSTPPPIDYPKEDEDFNQPLGSLAVKDDYGFESSENVEDESDFASYSSGYDNHCFITNNSPPPLELNPKTGEDTSLEPSTVKSSTNCAGNNANTEKINTNEDTKVSQTTKSTGARALQKSDIVTIEDIPDDSSDDEQYAFSKLKHLKVAENSEDFCAIHVLDTAKGCEREKNSSIYNFSTTSEVDDLKFETNFSQCPAPATTLADSLTKGINEDHKEEDGVVIETHSNPQIVIEVLTISNDSEDEDDFGEFSTASYTPTANADESSFSKPGYNEVAAEILPKIKFALEQIFPIDANVVRYQVPSGKSERSSVALKLESIDHAKALEYHWTNSEVRHAYIKSLGIDSRNILYGDHWNASMPRFAANLSFNPLKPIKPYLNTTVNHPPPPNVYESTHIVPEVEFDWTNSGLVDPLSGPHDDDQAQKAEPLQQPQEITASKIQWEKPNLVSNAENINKIYTSGIDNTTITSISSSPCYNSKIKGVNADLPMSETVEHLEMFVDDLEDASINTSVNEINFGDSNILKALQISAEENEVVTTSIYAGPLKETHIYTPSKSDEVVHKTIGRSISSAANSFDFDYEKAAAGIIINETVVKKEYRDVEYNPGFTVGELTNSYKTEAIDKVLNTITSSEIPDKLEAVAPIAKLNQTEESEYEDEFTDWQSSSAVISKESIKSRTGTPVVSDQMILCPAVLLPQSVSIGNKPKIEWGDAAGSINPEELARIEELFSQPRKAKAKEILDLQKCSPAHANTPQEYQLSISASIAHKELHDVNDEDDWSEFVSVPAAESKTPILKSVQTNINPNVELPRTKDSENKFSECQPKPFLSAKNVVGNSNDDEWSDFVSSAPNSIVGSQLPVAPQFNSAAWQNANFYNNPLSFYHQSHSNINNKSNNNNNNNNKHSKNNYNINNNQYLSKHTQVPQQPQRLSQPQQIHMLQDFSTMAPYRPNHIAQNITANTANANQYQIGSAKVAPSVSLIPDLGFVAPSITHTAFFNTLPKPSFSAKK